MYDFAARTNTEVHIHKYGCMTERSDCIINLVSGIKVEYTHQHGIICQRNAPDFH